MNFFVPIIFIHDQLSYNIYYLFNCLICVYYWHCSVSMGNTVQIMDISDKNIFCKKKDALFDLTTTVNI